MSSTQRPTTGTAHHVSTSGALREAVAQQIGEPMDALLAIEVNFVQPGMAQLDRTFYAMLGAEVQTLIEAAVILLDRAQKTARGQDV